MTRPTAWRILGPVEVAVGDTVLPIHRPQELATVALLLLNANLVVPTDRVIDALWETSPPTARTAVQTYISRCRRALRDAGAADVLLSQAGGYRLLVAEGELDAATFADLVAAARTAAGRGDPATAAQLLRRGLALWRGPALGGAVAAFVASAATTLAEQRLTAHEELADAELAMGRHEAVVRDLSPVLAANPLRERLAARLMIALAGRGQQAEALQVYAKLRSRLDAELGVEPGSEIDAVHLQVLRQQVPRPAVAGDLAAARPSRPKGPAQLPRDTAVFAGRAATLRQLDMLLLADGAATPNPAGIAAIDGTAGVGKTTLAVHWAHRVADRFPDGQLYVNLRGFSPIGSPMAAADALRTFLHGLGVPRQQLPTDVDTQATLYRSMLADKRVLVVLDNARDAEQVRPLLPGAAGCQVVVTSRNRLISLAAIEGAQLLTLDVLTDQEARQLLVRRLGAARVADEPDAIDEIIRACVGLPLALAVVAAHAATQRHLPLAALTAGLRAERGALDAFACGDPVSDIRAVFSWSYTTLEPGAAAMFRLLALHPGPDVSLASAVSLAGAPARQVRRRLAELVQAHLVTEQTPGRFTMHDLLRAFSAEQAQVHDSDVHRHTALTRLLDHYVHTAHRAARALNPLRDPINEPLRPAGPGVTPEDVVDHDEAMAWFSTERPGLVAAVEAAGPTLHLQAWQLAWSLVEYLDRRGHWQDWVTTQDVALRAARRLDHLPAQAQSHRSIGTAYIRLGRHDDALAHFRQALDVFGALGDQAGQTDVQFDLCAVYEGTGSIQEALSHARHALERYRSAGNRRGAAQALNALGWYHGQLDEYAQGLSCCQEALTLLRALGDRHGQAESWGSIGYAQSRLGRHDDAVVSYRQALVLSVDVGDRYGEGWSLAQLGDTHAAAGDPVAAQVAWRQALEIFDELGHSDAEQVRDKLELMPAVTAEPEVVASR